MLITDGLADKLRGKVSLDAPNVRVLALKAEPKSLLELTEAQVNALREPLLQPLKASFEAPNKVALYLFTDRSWVLENFNDMPVMTKLNGIRHEVPARGWIYKWNE